MTHPCVKQRLITVVSFTTRLNKKSHNSHTHTHTHTHKPTPFIFVVGTIMRFNLVLVALCLVGFLLSSYAYTVEVHADRAKELGLPYRAYCDIGPFSCTKVFSSEFGSATQFFGLPKTSNALVGMAYYLAEMFCCWNPTLILLISAPSIAVTVCLAFILTVVLHDLCVVCCSIYVVNIATAYLSYRWWKRSQAPREARASGSATSAAGARKRK